LKLIEILKASLIVSQLLKSIRYQFGTNDPEQGKGPGRLFDGLLHKKIVGEAGVDYDIKKTPLSLMVESLARKYEQEQVEDILKKFEFLTMFLGMSVKINNPGEWILKWARFGFEFAGDGIAILSSAPDFEGVKTTIERNGSRDVNLSLAAEFGPSMTQKTTDLNKSDELTVVPGVKISPGITYDRKDGWIVKYEKKIDEVKGFKSRLRNGNLKVTWDIYRNPAIEIPCNNIGDTAVAYGSALIVKPRSSDAMVIADVSGEAVSLSTRLRREGLIELASIAQFSLEPTEP
jgi:hypothetical protein